jgi:transcriptional regulator
VCILYDAATGPDSPVRPAYPRSVYLPPHFTAPDTAGVAAFVDAVAAADLVTFDGTKPVASLIPIIWDRDSTEQGRLLGHLALANPQWQSVTAGATALAIVHGPQAYVSPAWYPSQARHGRVVPTWNYVTVHFTGPLTVHRDPEWIRDVVTRLTQRHEQGRPVPWAVTDAPPDYINGQLRGIVGVELTIDTVQAKHKLSQNRGADDRASVATALRTEPGPGAAEISALMSAGE